MKIITITIPNGNFAKGRTQKVNTIVMHWIVGSLAAADGVFKKPGSQLSAHYAIENTIVHKYVSEADTAYHAKQANPFSIGIEHSAAPGRPPSKATLQTSIKLVAEICKRHKLDPRKAVQPHNKYVATQCPGTVDWKWIRKQAYNLLKGDNDLDYKKKYLAQKELTEKYKRYWERRKKQYQVLLKKLKNLIGGK